MKLRLFVMAFLLYIIVISSTTQAYTNAGGVERGDIVNMDYELEVDGQQEDSGTLNDAKIDSDGGWIEGFWKGVRGAKLNTPKTFTVQPDEGYTDEGHNLYNKVLIFTVVVLEIVFDSSEDGDGGANTGSSGDGTLSKILNVGKWIGLIGGGIVIMFMFSNRKTVFSTRCEHCKSMGRDTLSEGTCSKCGNAYCRSSFSRGCPNCKGNSFIPSK